MIYRVPSRWVPIVDDSSSKLCSSVASAELGAARFLCWYRVRSNGSVELFAGGHRISLPIEDIPLLPESIARPLLAAIHAHSAQLHDTDQSGVGLQVDPGRGAAHPLG
jgi:hypothetical protein